MCMNEQCRSPRFASHPQCVELRQQQQRNQDEQMRN
jgi:hypothetical protein